LPSILHLELPSFQTLEVSLGFGKRCPILVCCEQFETKIGLVSWEHQMLSREDTIGGLIGSGPQNFSDRDSFDQIDYA